MRSHQNAAAAHKAGLYNDEILPVDGVNTENGFSIIITASLIIIS